MILLDTHALIWADSHANKLGRKSQALLARHRPQAKVAVSALSFWEVEMLQQNQRIRLANATNQWRQTLLQGGLIEIAVDGAIALRAAGFTSLHGDPIDRLIAATALERNAILLTADERLLAWKSDLQRQDVRL